MLKVYFDPEELRPISKLSEWDISKFSNSRLSLSASVLNVFEEKASAAMVLNVPSQNFSISVP